MGQKVLTFQRDLHLLVYKLHLPVNGKTGQKGMTSQRDFHLLVHSFFFNKNVVFPAQAEYSYSSADFRLKIFQYYSQFIAHDISVLDYTGGISYSQFMFSRFVAQFSPLENGISGKHITVLYLQLLNTKNISFSISQSGVYSQNILKILRISALIFL